MNRRPRHQLKHGLSWVTRGPQQDEAEESLLGEADVVDNEGLYPPFSSWTSNSPPEDPHAHLPVYTTIHRIRQDIINSIDDPYSLEQLRSARMNIQVIRPLVDNFYELNDVSIIYCLLVNRLQFLREQSYRAHHQSTNLTRALVCELIAEKIIRRFNEHNPGPKGLLLLANVLVAGFEPFQNAPQEVIQENTHARHWAKQKGVRAFDHKLTALEIAIISESKGFLSSTACQKVVEAIYIGRLCYTPSSFIDIIPDRYKHRPISLYDPRRGPLLNQYRLIVPRTRNILEVLQFAVLLAFYLATMIKRRPVDVTPGGWECAFMIYAFGWCLDQLASILEHGWQVYTENLWSFLDVVFCFIFVIYFYLRLHALAIGSLHLSITATDVLSCAAPILIPRIAFNILSENMLFVSLRAMMADFFVLTLLALWCFGGFLLSMKWLNSDIHREVTIAKWMIYVWFGLDGTGIQRSTEFHWLLGPILMVSFAFLGNTLFLTILVSMLTNTFSSIVKNAAAEIAFRRAVLTFEGVKSDAIHAYYPPFNILALLFMLPLKFFITPRWFHKVNVALVRIINAPILLIITLIERRTLWRSSRNRIQGAMTPFRRRLAYWNFARFSVHGDIQAVFDTPPPLSVLQEIEEEDDLDNTGNDQSAHPTHHPRKLPSAYEHHSRTQSRSQSRDPPIPPNRISDRNGANGNENDNESDDNTNENPEPRPPHHPSIQFTNTDPPPRRRRSSTLSFDGNNSPPLFSNTQHHHRVPSRKDSMLGLLGGSDYYTGTSDIFNDVMQETGERLEALERGIKRVERLLGRCLEEGVLRGSEDADADAVRGASGTGTMSSAGSAAGDNGGDGDAAAEDAIGMEDGVEGMGENH